MRRFAIIGAPVSHSLSPEIFNEYFRLDGVDARYSRIASEDFHIGLKTAELAGIEAVNITAPFKDSLSLNCMSPIPLNCYKLKDKTFENTDIHGVSGALFMNKIFPMQQNVCVVGAGGAAESAIIAIKEYATKITVVNRTNIYGRILAAQHFVGSNKKKKLNEVIENSELLIFAASGISGFPKKIKLHKKLSVLDANYGKNNIREIAKSYGCKYISGRQWLLWQAKFSYEFFLGNEPQTIDEEIVLKQNPGPENLPIAICGFSGSGKSTVGKMLARKLGYSFFDVDEIISAELDAPIDEIFQKFGENEFRAAERRIVEKLAAEKKCVIALGGGVNDNLDVKFLRASFYCIWLLCGAGDCLARVKNLPKPMLKNKNRHAIEYLFEKRKNNYFAASSLIANASEKPEKIADLLYEEINNVL